MVIQISPLYHSLLINVTRQSIWPSESERDKYSHPKNAILKRGVSSCCRHAMRAPQIPRNNNKLCEIFEDLTAMMIIIMMFFWVLEQCKLVGRWQRSGETYFLIFNPEDGGSNFLRNTGTYRRVYKTIKPYFTKISIKYELNKKKLSFGSQGLNLSTLRRWNGFTFWLP